MAYLGDLKAELLNDPNNLGYAPTVQTRDDSITASIINEIRGDINIRRNNISGSEIWSVIDPLDIKDLSAVPTEQEKSVERKNLSWLNGLAPLQNVELIKADSNPSQITMNLLSILKPGSNTLTSLFSVAFRKGSRAEQLFGDGFTVSASDIGQALSE